MSMITFTRKRRDGGKPGETESVYLNADAIDVVTARSDGTEIVTRTGFKVRVSNSAEAVLKAIRLAKEQ